MKDFWEYDPAANSWTQKADFGGIARESAVGFSIGSKGYLGTGIISTSPYYVKDFWEYDPVANTWVQKADFEGIGRESAVGLSIGNKGYIGTGFNGEFPDLVNKDFWEYDPDSNTWTQRADFGGTARYGAVGLSIGNKGYLGTGNDLNFYFTKDFWEYDPDANTWTQKADFGGIGRFGAVGFNIGSKGYLGTGYYSNNYHSDFWEYAPELNTWMEKAYFEGFPRYNAVGFSIGSKGYIGTGFNKGWWPNEDYIYEKDFWEYTPDTSASICDIPTSLTTDNITATTAQLQWEAVSGAIGYRLSYKAAGSSEWLFKSSINNQRTIAGLSPNTEYTWKVKSICSQSPAITSDSTAQTKFITLPMRLGDVPMEEAVFEVRPNPISQTATVTFSLNEESPVAIQVMDVNGRSLKVIAQKDFSEGRHQIIFNRESLSAGIYFIQLKANDNYYYSILFLNILCCRC